MLLDLSEIWDRYSGPPGLEQINGDWDPIEAERHTRATMDDLELKHRRHWSDQFISEISGPPSAFMGPRLAFLDP